MLYFTSQLLVSFRFQEIPSSTEKQIQITIEKGILYRYAFEKKVQQTLYPDLLDNEHIPKRLFQYLNQDIKKNQVAIYTILFLDVAIFLFLIAYYYQVSFYFIFQKLILILTLVILMLKVLLIERNELTRNFQLLNHYIVLIPSFIDSIFIFIHTFLLFQKDPDLVSTRPFLDFYFSKKIQLEGKIKEFTKISRDMIIISIFAIFLSNLFLFPIYYIQIEYQLPFPYIFIIFFIFFITFYIYSYYHVSKNREENPTIGIASSFLVYRILQNLFYAIVFLIFTIFIISLAIIFIYMNLHIMESYGILPKKPSI